MAIVARWEWRTFGKGSFGKAEEAMRALPMDSNKKTDEVYILSRKSDENVKIRFELMDIKSLQSVNADHLEQWLPVMKAKFPMDHEGLKKLFGILKTPCPELKRDGYTYQQFIDELVKPNKDLKAVDVTKNRDIYKVDGVTAEIAETTFDGDLWRTICFEHEDPAKVMEVVRKLGLESAPNVNYIQAMKKSVGVE